MKIWPEKISGMFHAFTGHDGAIDYSVMFITSLKLSVLPLFALPLIEFFMTLEQIFSSGLMKESIEYISFSSNSVGVWYYESIAYGMSGALFAARIQYINLFSANILKVIILLALIFTLTQRLGVLFCAWFLSSLFVRPLVLWYSCVAVREIASKQGMDAINAADSIMPFVVILSFLTVFGAVLWPAFMLIMKVICDYISFAVYKGNKLARTMGMRK
jgi:uncharacterized Tic20 family protein